LDAILECFGCNSRAGKFLLLSQSEIYFDLPAGITINIIGNYLEISSIEIVCRIKSAKENLFPGKIF
jgi:hypothetical protein